MAIDKTKKFADLAYEYIRKKLVKPSKGGITSLPTEKEITNEMLVMFENLETQDTMLQTSVKKLRTQMI